MKKYPLQFLLRSKSVKGFFLLGILIFTLNACRKDEIEVIPEPEDEEEVIEEENPDCNGVFTPIITTYEGGTFESGPYLAAYPGSYWTFSNDDYLECELGHTNIIELTLRNFETCEEYYNHTAVTLPRIIGNYTQNSGEGFVYVDSILVDIEGETKIAQQTSTEVGSNWYEFIDDSHAYENPWYTFYPEREIIAHHDSIELPNGAWFYDVLQISHVLRYNGKDGEWLTGHFHLYYANEIGLIWEKNILNPSYDRYLTDYYIAPH